MYTRNISNTINSSLIEGGERNKSAPRQPCPRVLLILKWWHFKTSVKMVPKWYFTSIIEWINNKRFFITFFLNNKNNSYENMKVHWTLFKWYQREYFIDFKKARKTANSVFEQGVRTLSVSDPPQISDPIEITESKRIRFWKMYMFPRSLVPFVYSE